MWFLHLLLFLSPLYSFILWAQQQPLHKRLRSAPLLTELEENIPVIEAKLQHDSIHLEYFNRLRATYPNLGKTGLGVSMWAKKDPATGRFMYTDVATFAANARRAAVVTDVDTGADLLKKLEDYTAKNRCIPRLMIASHGLGSNFGGNGVAGVYSEGDGGFYLGERFKKDSIEGYKSQLSGQAFPNFNTSARQAHWLRKTKLSNQIPDPKNTIHQFFSTSATTDDLELKIKGQMSNYPQVVFKEEIRVIERVEERRGFFGNKKKKPKVIEERIKTIVPSIEYVNKTTNPTIKFCEPCLIQIHACSVSKDFGVELARISGCQTVWSTGKCSPLDFRTTQYDNGTFDYFWTSSNEEEHHLLRAKQKREGMSPYAGEFLRATPTSTGEVLVENAGRRYVADEYGVSEDAKQIFDGISNGTINDLINSRTNKIILEKLPNAGRR